MHDRGGAPGGGRQGDDVVLTESHLDRVLSGQLPCAVCRYELRGLSIRGVCPECGTPVRATILFRVDPKAKEFRPLVAPLITANAIAVWSIGGLIAGIGFWGTHVLSYARAELGWGVRAGLAESVAIFGLLLSWVGSLGLIRPVVGGELRKTLASIGGVLAYGLLVWSSLRLQAHDKVSFLPYLDAPPDSIRIALRAITGVAMILIIAGLRPNARALVERCLVLRTGRVSRQTLLAMVVAVGVGLVGDGLQLASWMIWDGRESVLSAVGTLLIALSGAFILAGLVHAQLDTWQIRKSLLAPSPTLEELIDPDEASGAG